MKRMGVAIKVGAEVMNKLPRMGGWLMGGVCLVVASVLFTLLHKGEGEREAVFYLTDHHGQAVSHKTYEGKPMLVFFGFSTCADICPAQMFRLTQVLDRLDAEGYQGAIQPVFISVDPQRDDAASVARFLQPYHKDFAGLTGSWSALAQAANAFATYLDSAPENAQPGYQLTHASSAYLVNERGGIVGHLSFSESVEQLVEKTQLALL